MTAPTKEPLLRLSKSLYDDLLAGHFSAAQMKVLLCVYRFTFGHRDQADGARLSRRFIAERTRLHERNVRRVRDELVAEGVLVQVERAGGRFAAKMAPDGCTVVGRPAAFVGAQERQ